MIEKYVFVSSPDNIHFKIFDVIVKKMGSDKKAKFEILWGNAILKVMKSALKFIVNQKKLLIV